MMQNYHKIMIMLEILQNYHNTITVNIIWMSSVCHIYYIINNCTYINIPHHLKLYIHIYYIINNFNCINISYNFNLYISFVCYAILYSPLVDYVITTKKYYINFTPNIEHVLYQYYDLYLNESHEHIGKYQKQPNITCWFIEIISICNLTLTV